MSPFPTSPKREPTEIRSLFCTELKPKFYFCEVSQFGLVSKYLSLFEFPLSDFLTSPKLKFIKSFRKSPLQLILLSWYMYNSKNRINCKGFKQINYINFSKTIICKIITTTGIIVLISSIILETLSSFFSTCCNLFLLKSLVPFFRIDNIATLREKSSKSFYIIIIKSFG